ncbi:FtsX-like permease family protein [Kitasatospora sp. NPDC048540]|uniref:FtsX-like permease family protein n=2 Tax=unclassified Kitasatospora TaxID=2633591 RepID=UPI0033FDD6C5
MKLSAWRAALRIARRDALRAKGRSALVIAMVALPVLGVTAADITARSGRLTPQEQATRVMGSADAYVAARQPGWRLQQSPDPAGDVLVLSRSGAKPTPTEEEAARAGQPLERLVEAALPRGAVLLPVETPTGYVGTSTAYGQLPVQTYGVDLGAPAARGLTTLREGAWPSGSHEVAATTAFLDHAGLKVGQQTTLAGTAQPLRITAAVEYPGDLGVDRLIGRPGELSGLLEPVLNAAGRSTAGDPAAHGWLVTVPGGGGLGWQDVQHANAYGFTVASRTVLADPPPDREVPLYRDGSRSHTEAVLAADKKSTVAATVVGMALLEMVLLAGPAFAVGARRSRRQLGLIAAGGGERSHVRGVVLAGGVVLGGVGALAGAGLGALAVALGRPWLESRSGARFGHFAVEPADLLGITAIGLLTAVLAAVVPAVQAARQDVAASLADRGTIRPPARWLTLLGAATVLAGAALALLGAGSGYRTRVVAAGSVLAELGLVLCVPFLVGRLGRLARLLPLGPRLALRDAGRHRGRTAPAVAAVMAAVAGAVAVLTFQAGTAAADRAGYAPSAPSGAVTLRVQAGDPAGPRAAVERSVPGLGPRADLQTVGYGACDGTPGGFCGRIALTTPAENLCPPLSGLPADSYGARITTENAERLLATDPRCRPAVAPDAQQFGELVAGDAALLHNLLGADAPEAAGALAEGRVVVLDPALVKDGSVTLALTRFGATGPEGNTASTLTLPAVAAKAEVPSVRAVLSPDAARRAGFVLAPAGSVWRPAQAPSAAAEQRAAAAVTADGIRNDLRVERGYRGGHDDVVALGLGVAASVVALAAAGIATGLAASDSQRDLATLAAVGAGSGIRRRLSGLQCALIAAVGAVLGTAAGLLPAAAVQQVQNAGAVASVDPTGGIELGTHPMVLPWPYLAAVLVGLPLLSWALAAGLTRSRVAMARRAD